MKKKILLLLGSILLCINTFAQDKGEVRLTEEPEDHVYVAVQVKGEYPGGMAAFFIDFIGRLNLPESLLNDYNSRYQVILQFLIEKDGSLTDIKVARDPGLGLGEEAMRVIKEMPKWIPAIQYNKPVRSQFTLPITITKGVPENFFIEKKDIPNEPMFGTTAYRTEGIVAYTELFKTEYEKRIEPIKEKKVFLIDFAVELDGSLTDIRVFDAITLTAVSDVSNIVQTLGKWNPGRVNSKPIRSFNYIKIELKNK